MQRARESVLGGGQGCFSVGVRRLTMMEVMNCGRGRPAGSELPCLSVFPAARPGLGCPRLPHLHQVPAAGEAVPTEP